MNVSNFTFCTFSTYIEELFILGEEKEIRFTGMEMERRRPLPLANVDFSLCVNIKTVQGGSIVSNLPKNLKWNDESKALCVDRTGVVRFISGQNIVCESTSRVNDDRWHEIAVVYSNEHQRYLMEKFLLIRGRLYQRCLAIKR
jgi:hypothetical protein